MQTRHRRRYGSKRIGAAVEMLESRLLLTSVVVNSVSDAIGGGVVTLRDAIAMANTSTTPTTITFDPTMFSSNQTILLANGVLELENTKEPTTIVGPSAGVSVSGNNISGVFLIDANVKATLSDMTVTKGTGVLDQNQTRLGGGIKIDGNCQLDDVSVTGNSAYSGGGVCIELGGSATLLDSTVSGNTAVNFGGGIVSYKGTANLTNVTVCDNSASISGGGINQRGSNSMTLTNCTISGNAATGTGAIGGGIYNSGYGEAGTDFSIANSIISGNTATDFGPDVISYFIGTENSFGFNLIGDADGVGGWSSTDRTGTAAKPLNADLGPLNDNGGPTDTMLPLPGSPAINAGSNALIPAGVTTDQRGLPRTYGGTVDIGAVETQPAIIAEEFGIDGVTPHGTYIAGRNVEGFVGLLEPIDATAPYTVTVNWGDGTANTSFPVTASAISATGFTEVTAYHTYKSTSTTSNVNGTLSFTVTDAKGVKSNSSGYGYTLTPAVATNAFSGEVFYDANDDGKLASTESGIANVVVYDDLNNNGVLDAGEPNVTTSTTGAFTLNVSGTGSGDIRTDGVPPDTQTTPASNGGYKVTLAGTTTQSGLNFGYYKSGGNLGNGTTIIGTVFNDANKNGKLDSGETGLAGVVVYNDANNNGKLDSGELSAVTNASGVYTLSLGSVGTALLRQVLPTGDTQTLPASGAGIHITLGAGAKFTSENFGDYVPIYSLTGTVYDDANKNGKKDTGELPLAGWEVYDDVANAGKFVAGDPFTFTNSTGAYTLSVSGSGTANLRQIVPANWSQTTPASNGAIHVALTSTSTKTGLNFGDYTAVKYLSTVATTSGLVAWWTFDSSSQANSIVNGYTGTLKGGAKIVAASGAPIAGETTSGLSLNGTGAYVDTNLTTQQEFTTTKPVTINGKPGFVTTAAATLNVWVNLGGKVPAAGQIETILAKSQNANDMDLQLESDGMIHFYSDSGSSTSFKPASLTGWHMLTAEFDTAAKTREIFWDGKLVISTNPYTGVHAPSINAFSIGESDVWTGRYYDGSIDEVSMWNRALTAAEILAIYNASK